MDLTRRLGSVLLLLLCGLGGFCECQTYDDLKALDTLLFTTNGYDKRLRPVYNQSQPLEVYINLFLLAINSLDEVSETLKTTTYLDIFWTDEMLRWAPENHSEVFTALFPQVRNCRSVNNVLNSSLASFCKCIKCAYVTLGDGLRYEYMLHESQQRHAPEDQVWKPDVALSTSVLDYKQLGDSSTFVEVYYQGGVAWSPFQVFQSSCSVDITYFPFDQQTCSLVFVAWSYSSTEIHMKGGRDGIALERFTGNSAWRIVNTTWYNGEENNGTEVVFEFTIERKPMYTLLTLIFPIIMLTILDIFVFALPSDSGEKASYAITVFLAFAVFMTIMQTIFPPNSDNVAHFAIYVSLSTVNSTVITLIALVMSRLNSFDERTPIPRWLAALARIATCKCGKIRDRKVRPESTCKPSTQILVREATEDNVVSIGEKDASESDNAMTWMEVVNGLDVIFIIVFTVGFITETLVFFLAALKY